MLTQTPGDAGERRRRERTGRQRKSLQAQASFPVVFSFFPSYIMDWQHLRSLNTLLRERERESEREEEREHARLENSVFMFLECHVLIKSSQSTYAYGTILVLAEQNFYLWSNAYAYKTMMVMSSHPRSYDVCMYVCIHVCMNTFMHACMHACMYVCMYVCMNACVLIYASMHVREAHTYIHTHMRTCMHTCMYAYMYAYTDTSYIHEYMHIHIHTSHRYDVSI